MNEIDLIRLFYGGQGRAPTCEPGVETLRPNAPGDECGIPGETGAPCPNHYLNVDEETPDEDTTQNYTTNDLWVRDLYRLPPHSQGCGAISLVEIWWRAKSSGLLWPSNRNRSAIKTHGTVYQGAIGTLSNSYAYGQTQWYTNPYTGQPWTWEEVDDLQVGVALRAWSPVSIVHLTQVYVEITYGP